MSQGAFLSSQILRWSKGWSASLLMEIKCSSECIFGFFIQLSDHVQSRVPPRWNVVNQRLRVLSSLNSFALQFCWICRTVRTQNHYQELPLQLTSVNYAQCTASVRMARVLLLSYSDCCDFTCDTLLNCDFGEVLGTCFCIVLFFCMLNR